MKHESETYILCFCDDPSRDPVAPGVLDAVESMVTMSPTDVEVDGREVRRIAHRKGVEYLVVRTTDVVSHDYGRYVDQLAPLFDSARGIALVNWHEGASAPDRIFCLHTTGDVPSGTFGPADPRFTGAVARSIESARVAAGLDEYRTLAEATHWSGMQYRAKAEDILRCPLPVIDVEIGSARVSWGDASAARVLAQGLLDIGASMRDAAPTVIFVGGTHFSDPMTECVIGSRPDFDIELAHVLPNQWVVQGGYEGADGANRLVSCVESCTQPVQAIVFHAKLQGPIKVAVRAAGTRLGIPTFSHKQFRSIELAALEQTAEGAA